MHVAATRDRVGHAVHRGFHNLRVTDRADRRSVTGAHTRCAHDPHIAAKPVRQFAQQMLSARHRTGKRIAHAHGDGGQRGIALLHHVEMGVKGRDLVDFRERELHLMGERREMGRREPPVFVLDEMEILDQEIAPALALAEERAHLGERNRIDLPPLWRARRPAPSAGWLVSDEGHNPSAFRHC